MYSMCTIEKGKNCRENFKFFFFYRLFVYLHTLKYVSCFVAYSLFAYKFCISNKERGFFFFLNLREFSQVDYIQTKLENFA